MEAFKYAKTNEAKIYDSVINGKKGNIINRLLMGTYVTVLDRVGDWYKITSVGSTGWMHKDDLTDDMGLKMFFVDVGQGDAMLLEAGNYKILIDGGPNNNMASYLSKWQYSYYLKSNQKVHIDYMIISHFDLDHYKGFIKLINDTRFTFGTIAHAGILKFKTNPKIFETGLGNRMKIGRLNYLTTIIDNPVLEETDEPPYNRDITNFVKAVKNAYNQGRVSQFQRYEKGDVLVDEPIEGKEFRIDVLGPASEEHEGKKGFLWWSDVSKTINGHSLILKIHFGERTILVTGDSNEKSQDYLIENYKNENPFDTDVAKSGHHGSSDFSLEFMKKMSAYATVFSSGDNESYSHPRADAIGCAGKYSKSLRPLIYSTELARSYDMRTNKILFGMINLRSDGKDIYISQMRESKSAANPWDAYKVK